MVIRTRKKTEINRVFINRIFNASQPAELQSRFRS